MESCILNQQGIIQATSYVFWVMQFTRNIPKDDEQHFLRATSRRSVGKLHGRLCNTSQDYEKTVRFLKIAGKHNLCFKRSKCDFNMEEIPILGVIVGKEQVKMEQKKIKAIKE